VLEFTQITLYNLWDSDSEDKNSICIEEENQNDYLE